MKMWDESHAKLYLLFNSLTINISVVRVLYLVGADSLLGSVCTVTITPLLLQLMFETDTLYAVISVVKSVVVENLHH